MYKYSTNFSAAHTSLSSEKVYSFHLDLENGEWVRASLLRSVECFGNAAVGDKVYLDMPEQGVVGYATLLSIDDAPAVENGPGCRITGLFQHSHGTVLDLKLAGERDDIGVTPQHPIWSEDRCDWIPAGELQPGERVKTLEGTTIVESLSLRNEPEPVYNIEVEGDHVYRVGESGVLVHNTSASCNLFPSGYFGGTFTTGGPNSPMHHTGTCLPGTGTNIRAERAEARVCATGGGSDPTPIICGWNTAWNMGLSGQRRVSRCHLLGKQFGGEGTRDNLVPCCHSINLQMEVVENQVAAFITQNGCVDIRVVANYATPGRRIPSSITFTAKGVECSTGMCRTFSITVNNPPALTQCPVI